MQQNPHSLEPLEALPRRTIGSGSSSMSGHARSGYIVECRERAFCVRDHPVLSGASNPALSQARVDFVECRRARAKVGFRQGVEGHVDGVEVPMQILGLALDIEKPGDHLANL